MKHTVEIWDLATGKIRTVVIINDPIYACKGVIPDEVAPLPWEIGQVRLSPILAGAYKITGHDWIGWLEDRPPKHTAEAGLLNQIIASAVSQDTAEPWVMVIGERGPDILDRLVEFGHIEIVERAEEDGAGSG